MVFADYCKLVQFFKNHSQNGSQIHDKSCQNHPKIKQWTWYLEIGYWKPEDGDLNLEIERWKPENGDWKLEGGAWKLEKGIRKQSGY